MGISLYDYVHVIIEKDSPPKNDEKHDIYAQPNCRQDEEYAFGLKNQVEHECSCKIFHPIKENPLTLALVLKTPHIHTTGTKQFKAKSVQHE